MPGSTNRRCFLVRGRSAGLRLACALALAGVGTGLMAQGVPGATSPPPGPRRVTEVSTVPQAPVIVQGGHWGPGDFGGTVPGVNNGVTVIAPNVVLGWGGRPPFHDRPVPAPLPSWGGGAPHAGGGYPGQAGHPGAGRPVPYPGAASTGGSPGSGGQPPPGSLHRWSSGSGTR